MSNAVKDQLNYIRLKIYADKQMLVNYKSPKRILIKEVVDYFLHGTNGTYQHPVMTARILEWTGELDKSEKLLLSNIDSWEAKKHLALLKQRMGDKTNAYMWASNLVKSAPWRSESYDVFTYIAQLEGDSDTESKMKIQSEKVFEQEMVYYNDLQKL